MRVVLLACAVAAVAWLAIGLRDQRRQDAGVRLLRASPPQAQAALERLDGARMLNASSQPDVYRALAFGLLGRHERAVNGLRAVLRDEPENRSAWLLLAAIVEADDPALAAQARRRAHELDPRAR